METEEIVDEFATVTEVRRVWWPGDLYVHGDRPIDTADFWRDLGCTEPIPDSNALPAVARLLAETPDLRDELEMIQGLAVDAITSACIRARVNGDQHECFAEYQRAQDVLEALIAALEPEATPASQEGSWVPGGAYRAEIAPGLEAAKAALEPEVGR